MDFMHTVDLGIWVHLITAIGVKIENILKYKQILSPAQISQVWDKLQRRGMQLNPDDSMIKLNWYKANIVKHLTQERLNPKEKFKKPQAWEHHLLMNVCVPVCPDVS